MSIKMVRQPSNTPNLNNIDDIIPFRYAYGNQDGYVINRGNELSCTINGSEFKINSGRIVLQGVESDIDANGVAFTVDTSSSTKQYYVVYYRVNLATNTVSIESIYDIAGYPTIDKGDDLTKTTSGYACLELYRFEVQNGVISNVNKTIKAIKYTKEVLVDNAERVQGVDFSDDNASTFNNKTVIKTEVLFDEKTVVGSGGASLNLFKNINSGDMILIEGNLDGAGIKPYIFKTVSMEDTNNSFRIGEVSYRDSDGVGIAFVNGSILTDKISFATPQFREVYEYSIDIKYYESSAVFVVYRVLRIII